MFKRLVIALFGLLAAGAVQAVPFSIDGTNSSVDTSGISLCGSCSVTTALNPLLDLTTFDLNEGGSHTFAFFDISATNSGLLATGAIGGVLTATLAFAQPIIAAGTGVALAGATWLLGAGTGGLTFISQPADILFGNGGIFSVAFSNAGDSCFGLKGCTLSGTVNATITLVRAPTSVAAPGTLALLGLGLLGLGLLRRQSEKRAA